MSSWRASVLDDRVMIAGELRTRDAMALWQTLGKLARGAHDRLDLDLSSVSAIDARPMALLIELRGKLVARGVQSELIAPESMRSLLELLGGHRAHIPLPKATQRATALERIGAAVEHGVKHMNAPVTFLGEVVEGGAEAIRHPRRGNWRSLPQLLERAGADAILIVLLLDFLVGFVIALQAMPQLKALGANPYVADLVGVSVTRELGPLMTAIIMSGRSGAAYAAELGTMHVSDEIDALETMGISPVPYLVIPRVIALALVAPALVLLADTAAILGGMVVGIVYMDLTVQGYFTEMRTIVVASDVWSGVVKGMAFAVAIAMIACQEGLAARGAAAGVGRRTTATVVVSLFAVVVIDAVLTIMFRMAGV